MTLVATGAAELPPTELDWRTEVKARGKFWNWRKGSRKARQFRYGGKFDELPPMRQAEYEVNKERQKQTR